MRESAATASSINFQFSNAELVVAPDPFARQLGNQLSPYFALLLSFLVVSLRSARKRIPRSVLKNR